MSVYIPQVLQGQTRTIARKKGSIDRVDVALPLLLRLPVVFLFQCLCVYFYPLFIRELMSHDNITFNDNGTVSTRPHHPLIFQKGMSGNLREDDVFMMPNIALLVSLRSNAIDAKLYLTSGGGQGTSYIPFPCLFIIKPVNTMMAG